MGYSEFLILYVVLYIVAIIYIVWVAGPFVKFLVKLLILCLIMGTYRVFFFYLFDVFPDNDGWAVLGEFIDVFGNSFILAIPLYWLRRLYLKLVGRDELKNENKV